MISKKKFFTEQKTPSVSETMTNTRGTVLTIQATGAATSFEYEVLGCSDLESGEFVVLNGINTGSYSIYNQVSELGIYQYDITGIGQIKVNLASVSGGDLTITGISSEG